MSVYPFYTETKADGRRTPISGGTRRKDGNMRTVIFQRNCGNITKAFTIECTNKVVEGELMLVSSVYDCSGKCIAENITHY